MGGGTPGTGGTLSACPVAVRFTVKRGFAVHIVLASRLLWLALNHRFWVKAGGRSSSRSLPGLRGGTRPRRGVGVGWRSELARSRSGPSVMGLGLVEGGAMVWWWCGHRVRCGSPSWADRHPSSSRAGVVGGGASGSRMDLLGVWGGAVGADGVDPAGLAKHLLQVSGDEARLPKLVASKRYPSSTIRPVSPARSSARKVRISCSSVS